MSDPPLHLTPPRPPADCAPDLWRDGRAVLIFAGPRPWLVEEYLERSVRRHGLRVDFSACGGRWRVVAFPDEAQRVVRLLRGRFDDLVQAAARVVADHLDGLAYEVEAVRWVEQP